MISDVSCGQPNNLRLIGNLSVVSRRPITRHPVIMKSRPMSEFGRVTVTTKLGQLSQIMTDFQSELTQLPTGVGSNPRLQVQSYHDYTSAPAPLKQGQVLADQLTAKAIVKYEKFSFFVSHVTHHHTVVFRLSSYYLIL